MSRTSARTLARPIVVVSDVHLRTDSSAETTRDLARFVRAHRGYELVCAGDVFDLAADPGAVSRGGARTILDQWPDLTRALREHVHGGGALTLVAGNHDADVASTGSRESVRDLLEASLEAPIDASPWFVRRGSVHIEHGHVHDEDNAPSHPLAPWSEATEPLGIALTRRLLAPMRAYSLAAAEEASPIGAIHTTVRTLGARSPELGARFVATALHLCWLAARSGAGAVERARGDARVDAYAREVGLDGDAIRKLASAAARPTSHDPRATALRLYLDRVVACTGVTVGAVGTLAGDPCVSPVLGAFALGFLAWSALAEGKSRYAGRVVESLRDAADLTADATGASLVVFGHTHKPESGPRYVNSGSFGDPRGPGRPYVHIDTRGAGELRWATA